MKIIPIPTKVADHINTILFDFDGTLVDSHACLFAVYKRFMELNNCEGTYNDFLQLVGPTIPEVVNKIIEKHRLKGKPQDLIAAYEKLLKQIYLSEIELFPGVRETLDYLLQQGSCKLGLVTSADQKLVESFLKRQNLYHHFDLIVTPDKSISGKPSPDLYLKALRSLQITPQEALAIEDSEAGVSSAVAAGIFTLFLQRSLHEKLKKDYHDVLHLKSWNEVYLTLKNLF